ncbi:hypothetical protein IV203_017083 [Nitzschia inconspicua]|uniref:Uncharacterized protein n=1 Tax=Nitzschia inconspicua TaxID=303405 RepID=A0A9K3KSR1_9STRA|nr:hypothetical protein IV203_017083 [Nitzschia inconspicua]
MVHTQAIRNSYTYIPCFHSMLTEQKVTPDTIPRKGDRSGLNQILTLSMPLPCLQLHRSMSCFKLRRNRQPPHQQPQDNRLGNSGGKKHQAMATHPTQYVMQHIHRGTRSTETDPD